jgi:hypothetical protein
MLEMLPRSTEMSVRALVEAFGKVTKYTSRAAKLSNGKQAVV